MNSIFVQDQETLEKDAWDILTGKYKTKETELQEYFQKQKEILRSLNEN